MHKGRGLATAENSTLVFASNTAYHAKIQWTQKVIGELKGDGIRGGGANHSYAASRVR